MNQLYNIKKIIITKIFIFKINIFVLLNNECTVQFKALYTVHSCTLNTLTDVHNYVK